MVFYVSIKDDCLFFFWYFYLVVEFFMYFQFEDMLKFIDYFGYIRVGGNQYVFWLGFYMCFDDFFGFVVSYCYGSFCDGGFCMCIGYEWLNFLYQLFFDGFVQVAVCCLVCIEDMFGAIGGIEDKVLFDDIFVVWCEVSF